jgi:hypothetical protein
MTDRVVLHPNQVAFLDGRRQPVGPEPPSGAPRLGEMMRNTVTGRSGRVIRYEKRSDGVWRCRFDNPDMLVLLNPDGSILYPYMWERVSVPGDEFWVTQWAEPEPAARPEWTMKPAWDLEAGDLLVTGQTVVNAHRVNAHRTHQGYKIELRVHHDGNPYPLTMWGFELVAVKS